MPLLTIPEYKKVQVEWLDSEIKQHQRDSVLAEGKINELKELRDRLHQLCDYCGNRMYGFYTSNTNEMNWEVVSKHMLDRHPDDYEAFLEARREGSEAPIDNS